MMRIALAIAFERFADDFLTATTRVDIGGVEKVNAGVNRAVNDGVRVVR
ncbi:MAG: hypothetical protein KatS3mg052_0764 [Candidatus Roseilinea sp.]|nr:MAG: hypothetical protein KatS3mg052_0764 [Candidatus Roseilinea sp.]